MLSVGLLQLTPLVVKCSAVGCPQCGSNVMRIVFFAMSMSMQFFALWKISGPTTYKVTKLEMLPLLLKLHPVLYFVLKVGFGC